MRIGQSIWSREDFNLKNPINSSLFSIKSHSDTELRHSFDLNNDETEQETILPHGNVINSSKKLFSNVLVRNRIYEERQFISSDGTTKTVYYFRATKISVDSTGPFWPMAFPIKHPTPLFSSITRNEKKHRFKELYYLRDNRFLGTNNQQTFDNQSAIYKYTDVLKHPILTYDMDKSPRQQQPKANESELMCPSLIFESRFEGGNLRQVKRVGQFEYELVLRPDLYTRRHTQWYYFRVQNMIANITYRFRIINLVKKSSLYNEGMQILLYSDVTGKKELRGWHRVGHHINYSEYKQRTYNPLLERDINYFELDFQLEFTYSSDTCYIAHCYPYTFTDLKDDLDHLSSIRPRDIFRRDILCESQAGNSCFIVTVTDEAVPINEKKFIFITARIHPGETNSSYMMRGLLEFITSDDKIAKKLRSQIVFKIVPMLNPDGVIIGNYRCSLTGKDMNRNFRHPRKQTFPTIFHIKELMQNLRKEQHEILAFCDLHGHSRKSNVFAYGCDGCDGPQPDMRNFLNARVLPFIMSRTAPEMFAFDYCKFHIHRCKESTGRVVMWKEMLIKNSFTLEASFAGSSMVEKPCHFNIQDYEKFGQYICESLRQYLDVLSDSTRLDSIFMDITKRVLRKLGKDKIPPALLPIVYPEEKQTNEPVISINSISSCLEVLAECHKTINEQDAITSSDSDSDPEGGELPDISYDKDEQLSKKKLKKKRPEKVIEERTRKLVHKREIDKTVRAVPPRGVLFTSKYAKRSGHGLPIFTTERALERKQKRSNSVLQDFQLDRQLTDDYDTDTEPEQNPVPAVVPTATNNSTIKRTASFVSLTLNDLPSPFHDQSIATISGTLVSQTPIFKTLPQRRLKRTHRHQQNRTSNGLEIDQMASSSQSFVPMPNLMELATRTSPLLNHSSSTNNHDMSFLDSSNKFSFDTQTDSNGVNHHRLLTINDNLLRPFSKNEIPTLRNGISTSVKMPAVNGNNKRPPSQKGNNNLESVLRERSITIANEYMHQPDAMERVNQILKQLYVPTEKSKRS